MFASYHVNAENPGPLEGQAVQLVGVVSRNCRKNLLASRGSGHTGLRGRGGGPRAARVLKARDIVEMCEASRRQ